ncbi:MAG TPA: mycofactocin-coupled SDR family oxidoreductase [Pseudonocardia sp.]|jgi:(+)-trans-carveol dehydrogenase
MGDLAGKVAFISGVARGQGRAHALRLAADGARIIGFDICADIETVPFPLGGVDQLAETERLVRAAGGEIVATVADVREAGQVEAALAAGLDRFGRVDIVVANAGIAHPLVPSWEISDQAFRDVVEVNLVGVWRTAKVAVPTMIEAGRGGSIVMTGSGASVKGIPNLGGYVAAKHGLLGLVRTMGRELGQYQIRVNAVLPGNTMTPMFDNEAMRRLYLPDVVEPTQEQFVARASRTSPMGVPYVQPDDISEAVAWLASDATRFVTGSAISVDAGSTLM